MADASKHRLRMWLASEKAMGAPSVPHVKVVASPARSETPMARHNSASSSRPVANPAPARPAPIAPAVVAPRAMAAVKPAAGSENALLPVWDGPFESPVLSPAAKVAALEKLNSESVKGCSRCGLHKSRTQTVFGEGDPDAAICFVGEGPGKDEDASGRPFVGKAGQKLDEMIRAMGLERAQVYICNIVKCRAYLTDIGKDRPPSDEETAACTPFLMKQLEIVRPRVIVTLGLPSTRFLLKSKDSMTRMRGKWQTWRGIRVMPTWHPAYVLRNYTSETRAQVWDDLKKVLVEVGLPIPKRSGKQE